MLSEAQTVYVQPTIGQSWEEETVVKQTRPIEYEVLGGGWLNRHNRHHLRAGRQDGTLERALVDIEMDLEEELEEPVWEGDEPENREQRQPEGRGIRTRGGRCSKPPERYGAWCYSYYVIKKKRRCDKCRCDLGVFRNRCSRGVISTAAWIRVSTFTVFVSFVKNYRIKHILTQCVCVSVWWFNLLKNFFKLTVHVHVGCGYAMWDICNVRCTSTPTTVQYYSTSNVTTVVQYAGRNHSLHVHVQLVWKYNPVRTVSNAFNADLKDQRHEKRWANISFSGKCHDFPYRGGPLDFRTNTDKY